MYKILVESWIKAFGKAAQVKAVHSGGAWRDADSLQVRLTQFDEKNRVVTIHRVFPLRLSLIFFRIMLIDAQL